MCIVDKVINQRTDTAEESETTVPNETKNIEVNGGAVTEQVMEPNITINKPGEPEDEESEESNEEETTDRESDVNRMIQDLAYFLRAHKFQDYDRRYFKSINEASTRPYEEFPRPPLRSLHWEVHKNCDLGFHHCLRYVDRIVRVTSLRREDDTLTIMRTNNWDLEKNTQQILVTQKDCQMAQRRDNLTVVPFQGPIERFQWRTTVSYYMCWYTMLEKPELEFFGDSCSNHANCLDNYGVENRDPRANDDKPFACALYSFCPDHCCPMKHLWYMRDCFQSPRNPCYEGNRVANRKCTLNREENQDFESLIRNRINVSCHCHESGYEWSSRYGICVDVNECTRNLHDCNLEDGQICINQPGSYACVCGVGTVYNSETKNCEKDPIFEKALNPLRGDKTRSKPKMKNIFESIPKRLGNVIRCSL
ncbi:uncharacterized protein [Venturia canescens]|uniref:uncharacterized protein n=1 Tax=Venturia canescens TaxID=32260 RepID=UPI001C9C98D7|nr:uncharacterized protein LOC122412359 [Venturia canescens]